MLPSGSQRFEINKRGGPRAASFSLLLVTILAGVAVWTGGAGQRGGIFSVWAQESLPSPEPAPSPAPQEEPPSATSAAASQGEAAAPDSSEPEKETSPGSSTVEGNTVFEKEPGQIRFTAWNLKNYVHVAGPPPAGSTEKPKARREVIAVAAMLGTLQPDILGVCEMGTSADLAALQAELKKAGTDLPHSEWVAGPDPSRHLALLSRFPITARQPATQLRYMLDDSQFPVQRGFLDVTVQPAPDYTLRLVGAHLKSRLDVPDADQELMRRNEAHLLRQYVDSTLTAAPETNLLVYGDFNDTRDQPTVKAVKGVRGAAAALTEIAAADDSGQRWTFYYPEGDVYSRIDFLLASAGLMPEVRKGHAFLPGGGGVWSRGSDHRPVTLDFPADEAKSRSRTRSKAPVSPKHQPKSKPAAP
ncbi:MAG: Endonuclease/Exonuclease/phosphatase family protein [Verrucomicrobiales bacterium]|nr:Endonuclease/Exonuclease/phosphatase family protein [Verrucomicrobiales bacterium]